MTTLKIAIRVVIDWIGGASQKGLLFLMIVVIDYLGRVWIHSGDNFFPCLLRVWLCPLMVIFYRISSSLLMIYIHACPVWVILCLFLLYLNIRGNNLATIVWKSVVWLIAIGFWRFPSTTIMSCSWNSLHSILTKIFSHLS